MVVYQDLLAQYNDAHSATNEVLTLALDQLGGSVEARTVRLRFLDRVPVQETALRLNVDRSSVYRYQTKGVEQLSACLLAMEQDERHRRQAAAKRLLPLSAQTDLVGAEEHIQQLVELIAGPRPHDRIAVVGLGGLGKTTVALAVMERLIQCHGVTHVGWVTAQQEVFSAAEGRIDRIPAAHLTVEALVAALLRQLLPDVPPPTAQNLDQAKGMLAGYLKQHRHVIVLDNIETLANLRSLWSVLQELANPTQFLITSRHSLYDADGVSNYPLPELSEQDTLALARQEGELKGIVQVSSAPDHALRPIFETVGGNPLAVKLVVGQLHASPLPAVLEDLRQAGGSKSDALYTFVYQRIWEKCLDDVQCDVLLAMATTPVEGGDERHMQAVTQLEPHMLREALQRLVAVNLLTAVGGLNQRLYRIHSLTRSFLEVNIAHWSPA
jgi:hypothetical protein